MGRATKQRKFALTKKTIGKRDERLKAKKEEEKQKEEGAKEQRIPRFASSLFFKYNTALAPPYQVLVDTNFINFSIQKKIELVGGMLACLDAKCIPCITDCVMAELEKLGSRYRLALRVARDPAHQRLTCSHTGTYADDCIVARVMQHKCYIVATNDRDLKRRVRRVPGVPIMSVGRQFHIEGLPDL